MSKIKRYQHALACTCHHYAPPLRVLQSVGFNAELAKFYVERKLSGEETVTWITVQLANTRKGWLYDWAEAKIDIDRLITVDHGTKSLIDDLFGKDERRFILRYLERAKRQFKNRLHDRMVFPVMMMHFAREIHLCATEGDCACGKARG